MWNPPHNRLVRANCSERLCERRPTRYTRIPRNRCAPAVALLCSIAALRTAAPAPMLYSVPPGSAENALQFHSFDAIYVGNLCAGDRQTEEHFVRYFSELLQMKLRSKLQAPHAIDDVRQETFARVFKTLRRDGGLRQPECLGAFVNTVCNNVLLEQYRGASRVESLDEEGRPEPWAKGADALDLVAGKQIKAKVREILLTCRCAIAGCLRLSFWMNATATKSARNLAWTANTCAYYCIGPSRNSRPNSLSAWARKCPGT